MMNQMFLHPFDNSVHCSLAHHTGHNTEAWYCPYVDAV